MFLKYPPEQEKPGCRGLLTALNAERAFTARLYQLFFNKQYIATAIQCKIDGKGKNEQSCRTFTTQRSVILGAGEQRAVHFAYNCSIMLRILILLFTQH